MGWRFRKSFTIVPGLRLNLSKSGLSASIGGAPFTVNLGRHGTMQTMSIPGTGISFRNHESNSPRPETSGSSYTPSFLPATTVPPSQISFVDSAPIEQVHSASTELLTSETLKDLKKLIQSAFEQHDEISRELSTAQDEKIRAIALYDDWNNGFLFKRLFKNALALRKAAADLATDKVAELEEQLKLSTIATYIELEPEQANVYYLMKDGFAGLCDSAAIWDVKTHQATDKVHERTLAATKVERQRVKFNLTTCDLIQWEQTVPHLQNAKGGDIYLYPGFILYRAAREAFSVIEYHDISVVAILQAFHEEDGVPSDSAVIGKTWAKCNKDGSRDKRFAGNYEIPIAQYGSVTFKSKAGLWEEFHVSNPKRLENFLTSLSTFGNSYDAVRSV
jgi:Protein of unknown function (DUF4236)